VIAWDSNPAGDYSTDPLEADLILRVYDPSDTLVGYSDYVYNNFEIVEFTAPTTGSYDFEVDEYAFTGTSTYVGFAVWPGHRDLTAYASQVLNEPPVSSDHFRVDLSNFWNAVGIRAADPAAAKNWIYLYSGSAFGDPADHVLLEDSRLSGSYPVDIVFADRNHAPNQDYFAEVREWMTADGYPIEWATHTSDLYATSCGTYGPFAFVSNDVVRIWDVNVPSGGTFHVRARVTSGSGDLGMALMDSDPLDSSSYYQGISSAEKWVDLNGNGADEVLQYYNAGASDWMGFAVYNNNSNSVIYELDVLCDLYLPLITK
jgi:hypothetical protein